MSALQMASDNETALLDQAQMEIFMHLLPVIVCMAVVCIVGILGNILTIVFYVSKSKRRASNLQITGLATADLLVCIMIIPNLIEMAVNVKYTQSIPCKLTHFFGLWTIAVSCFILWLIALDRYRKICKPFAKQMTVKTTKYSIAAIVIGSFVLSVRNFVNFTNTEVEVKVSEGNRKVIGHYCTTRDDPGYRISVSVFYVADFLFVIVCLVTIIVTYSCVICSLVKLKRKNGRSLYKTHSTSARCENTSVKDESDITCGYSDTLNPPLSGQGPTVLSNSSVDVNHPAQTTTLSNVGTFNKNSLRRTVTKLNARKRKRKMAARTASERKLTFMMLAVSVLFLLCFIPFFVIKIIMRLVLKSGVESELTVGIQFALKLVYVNSVFNPIIYCFFNPQFRKYLKRVFQKCTGCQVKIFNVNN